jgi:hypothetical protein
MLKLRCQIAQSQYHYHDMGAYVMDLYVKRELRHTRLEQGTGFPALRYLCTASNTLYCTPTATVGWNLTFPNRLVRCIWRVNSSIISNRRLWWVYYELKRCGRSPESRVETDLTPIA